MSLVVTDHHKLQYASSVQMVAQQTKNPFQNAVTTVPASGEAQSVSDLLDEMEYSRGEEKSRRNPETPTSGSRRWAVLQPAVEIGKYITKEEKFRTATDPTSNYVRASTMGVNRGRADLILGVSKGDAGTFSVTEGGVLGIAREGKTPGTGTVLPASQFIDHGDLGLVIEKLKVGQRMLQLADFGLEDNMDELFCAISPWQIENLIDLAIAAKQSLNAFDIAQLKDGKPTSLLGITWLPTNRLPYKKGTTDVRLCPIWSKANMIEAEWQPIKGEMWNDSSAKNLPYAYVSSYTDVVRAEDKGVVVIECKEVHA